MDKMDKISSVLHLVGGKPENVEKIVDEIDHFFDDLNADLEGWKVSIEEFPDGTRIYGRFQVLIKK
jgi:ABC-type Fe3+-hydroxamate transport system substrate-binding protein